MVRIAGVALSLAAFGAVVALVNAAAPVPAPPGIADKLRAFAAVQDDTDVLFFGSSHVYRGVDPREFDAAMRDAGHPVHSFNFAMPSMRPHEANALLRHVLSINPLRLRWVIIEWGEWSTWIAPANRFKERPVFWHDRRETLSAIEGSWKADLTLRDKLDHTATHALHFLQRVLAVGRGPAAIRAVGGRSHSVNVPDPSVLTQRGYSPFEPWEFQSGPTAEHRRRFLAETAAIVSAWEKLPSENRRAVDLSRTYQGPLAAQIDEVRAAGAEPVYLIMPTGQAAPVAYASAAAGLIPHLIAFNDPSSYPQLYRASARFDRGHLNEAGAAALSRMLAERFAAEITKVVANPATH